MSEQIYDFTSVIKKDTPITNHVQQKQKTKYFCRLCGSYSVSLPKAHLRDKHGADYKRTQNKAYDDIIKCLFTRCI